MPSIRIEMMVAGTAEAKAQGAAVGQSLAAGIQSGAERATTALNTVTASLEKMKSVGASNPFHSWAASLASVENRLVAIIGHAERLQRMSLVGASRSSGGGGNGDWRDT